MSCPRVTLETVTGTFPGLSWVSLATAAPITSLIVPLEFYVPNIKSAKKDLRKSRKAAVRNKAQRSALRTAVKKAKTTKASADERLSAVSMLDRAARKGLIHRNTAARQKSNLAKRAAAALAAA